MAGVCTYEGNDSYYCRRVVRSMRVKYHIGKELGWDTRLCHDMADHCTQLGYVG
jgi:hypothetical protein